MEAHETYLAHHGIKGQRWGIRRYQNPDGSLTAEGRKRKGLGDPRKSLFSRKKKEKTDEERKSELRNYLRDHPKKMPKYRKILTQEDVNTIVSNIEFDRKLKDIKQSEIDRGFNAIKRTGTRVATVAGLINQGLNMYNNVAKTYNLMYDLQERSGANMSNKKKLPIAPGGGGGNNK